MRMRWTRVYWQVTGVLPKRSITCPYDLCRACSWGGYDETGICGAAIVIVDFDAAPACRETGPLSLLNDPVSDASAIQVLQCHAKPRNRAIPRAFARAVVQLAEVEGHPAHV